MYIMRSSPTWTEDRELGRVDRLGFIFWRKDRVLVWMWKVV